MGKNLDYSFLNCLKKMPPLKHSLDGDFDINQSEVIAYIKKQPELLQKLFNMAQNRGVIYYSKALRKWVGVDFFG